MSDNFLNTSYADREKVKALGARWNPDQRKWYVPAGIELAPFSAWLPTGGQLTAHATANAGADHISGPESSIVPTRFAFSDASAGNELALAKRGITLSALLSGVSQAVASAYKTGVWTMVEVVDTRLNNGHVYIEISERTLDGTVRAQAKAVIWANNAPRILSEFERATGATVGPGIKLLVRARPVFKAQYGFSIEIDAIDSEYTLGDLEAKKRDIRTRLKQDGIFDANRLLPAPWDFNTVLVIAPDGAAGLGDFQAQAHRLQQFGICHFVYATSRFQGEGAAAEIRAAMLQALDALGASTGGLPDAVVLIRGGGAVNDLAWLNDLELARCICELAVPVFTGIGHERDSTVLDEVAHTKFDTPSKVIAGIEQVITRRVAEAKANFQSVTQKANRLTQGVRREVEQLDATMKSGASRQLALARQQSAQWMMEIRLGSAQSVKIAGNKALALVSETKQLASQQLFQAKQATPALMAEVTAEARQAVRAAKGETRAVLGSIAERAGMDLRLSRDAAERAMSDVGSSARQSIATATAQSEALMREVAGQGPDKTLARGFAIVRNAAGVPVTRAAGITANTTLDIQFRDGRLAAVATDNQ